MTIWILTDEVWAPIADRVVEELTALGCETLVVTPDNCADLVVEIQGAKISTHLGDTALDPPNALLYLRCPVPLATRRSDIDRDEADFVAQQWRMMLRGLVTAIEASGTPVLNPVDSILVDEKTAQLVRAARVGFTTPPALHAAHAGHAERFAKDAGQPCAMKPFAPFVRLGDDGHSLQRILTNVISAEALHAGLVQATVPSPTIVQPFIDAPFEHRVVVIGTEVFSARTKRCGANAIDVRRVSPDKAEVTAGNLPYEAQQRCIDLVRQSGLHLAAIDLLETVDAAGQTDFVFLDLNPSGHFYWVEQLTGAPICAALARLLQAAARDRNDYTNSGSRWLAANSASG